MDFNALKQLMEQETTEAVKVPNRLAELQSTRLPMDKIKRTMQTELIMQLACMVFFLLVPMMIQLPNVAQLLVGCSLLVVIGSTVIYLWQMQRFLKNNSQGTENSVQLLTRYVHQLRATLAVYKTAIITGSLVLPFTLALLYFGMISPTTEAFWRHFDFALYSLEFLYLTLGYLFIAIAIVGITEWWTRRLYGGYLADLENTLQLLKEEL